MATYDLTIPISDEDIKNLHVGDQVFLTGVIVTGRDAAHSYIIENFVNTGGTPPASEAALYEELPHVKEINTHIEPLATATAPRTAPAAEAPEHLRAHILALAEGVPRLRNCHNLRIWPGRDGYQVILHCLADPDLSVAEVHRLADQVERQVKAQVPGIGQVLVHVEPDSDD